MGLYEHHVLPAALDLACSAPALAEQRAKVIPLASGRVLEVGMGSALNLPFYDAERVEVVVGLEPNAGMRRRAHENVAASPLEVEWIDLADGQIPLWDDAVDTVVLTYTLCTIERVEEALAEMRRVLRPGGKLIFSEHGRAPDVAVQRWQSRVNPYWKRVAGGCNVNRRIPGLLSEAGFTIGSMQSAYLPGSPRWLGYNYWGFATADSE